VTAQALKTNPRRHFIATPNHWHSLMTIWAAQAGKHVYVEKPMSHDIAEGGFEVEEIRRCGATRHPKPQQRTIQPASHPRGQIREAENSYGYACKERDGIAENHLSQPGLELWRGPA
jgi:hypothetical protein